MIIGLPDLMLKTFLTIKCLPLIKGPINRGPTETDSPPSGGSMHGAERSGRRWVMTQRVFGLGPPTQSDVRHSSTASPPPSACCSRCFSETGATNNQPFQWPMAARASNVALEVFSDRAKLKMRPIVSPLKQFTNPFYCLSAEGDQNNGSLPTDTRQRLKKWFILN